MTMRNVASSDWGALKWSRSRVLISSLACVGNGNLLEASVGVILWVGWDKSCDDKKQECMCCTWNGPWNHLIGMWQLWLWLSQSWPYKQVKIHREWSESIWDVQRRGLGGAAGIVTPDFEGPSCALTLTVFGLDLPVYLKIERCKWFSAVLAEPHRCFWPHHW